ncbi:3-oxoacyl-[acyl-carrier-protein] reductase FabG [Adhaeretor mobilis]|uniref:3-oxoacyl-[acyl-carrier-protein] reductase FabG n=2 Tax=Adhaeretor mobilis TaxID=1930276 RepID=A0A517N0E2_9BACT|nr:3-oxoacyl-[acyl-carrier-protein] reductase FabG [Adhaeretor mobilis]
MLQLNVTTLTELTRRFLPDMVARERGRILNTASTAAFSPGPLQAVYYATKAFVVSFSQAIAEELCDDNVTVTALCPGAVATEFVASGDLEGVDLWKNAKSPESVASVGYEAMTDGKLVAINEWKLKVMLEWLVPFPPRRMVLKMSRQTMENRATNLGLALLANLMLKQQPVLRLCFPRSSSSLPSLPLRCFPISLRYEAAKDGGRPLRLCVHHGQWLSSLRSLVGFCGGKLCAAGHGRLVKPVLVDRG